MMETYFAAKLWFLVGFVGIGVLALIGIGIAGLVHKFKRRTRDRRKEREAAWAAPHFCPNCGADMRGGGRR